MPYSIKFEKPPAGYAAEAAHKGEKNVQVVFREFLSSEDGMKLIKRLEGFATQVLMMIKDECSVTCSSVDHLLVHFDRNGNGTAYVNELQQLGSVRLRKSVEKGDPIYEDDIIDYHELKFEGVDVPADHGVLVVFSRGWRKALYFDFEPIHPQGGSRPYNLWGALGRFYNYLCFQELHSLSDDDWSLLLRNDWFPFIGLRSKQIESLVGWLRSGTNGDEILEEAMGSLKERLPEIREKWKNSDVFSPHISLLNTAADRFEEGDWVSASSILYPRIEGILRSLARSSYSQSELAATPLRVSGKEEQEFSRLLPHNFERYLKEVYFRSFDPDAPSGISRNSVGHGVAAQEAYNEKASLIGFLIVEQIFYHLPEKMGAIKHES